MLDAVGLWGCGAQRREEAGGGTEGGRLHHESMRGSRTWFPLLYPARAASSTLYCAVDRVDGGHTITCVGVYGERR